MNCRLQDKVDDHSSYVVVRYLLTYCHTRVICSSFRGSVEIPRASPPEPSKEHPSIFQSLDPLPYSSKSPQRRQRCPSLHGSFRFQDPLLACKTNRSSNRYGVYGCTFETTSRLSALGQVSVQSLRSSQASMPCLLSIGGILTIYYTRREDTFHFQAGVVMYRTSRLIS